MEQGLSTISFSVSLDTVLTLGFYGIAATYLIFSAVMHYHWNEYSINAGVSRITLIVYLVTTLPLIATLGIITWSL